MLFDEEEASWYSSQPSHHHPATKPRFFSLLYSSAFSSYLPVLVPRSSDGVGSGVPGMGSWSHCNLSMSEVVFLPCLKLQCL